MGKRSVLAVLAVFVASAILDFLIHGLILKGAYEASADLWRPMAEMKMGLIYFVLFVSTIVFVSIYTLFVEKKSVGTGLKYGLLYGIGAGIGMGYGTYAVMPVPYEMALTWFLGTVVEATVAGALVGLIVVAKPSTCQTSDP